MGPQARRRPDGRSKYVISRAPAWRWPVFYNTYSVSADHIIPVDISMAGCPPGAEALLHALIGLLGKIETGMTVNRSRVH